MSDLILGLSFKAKLKSTYNSLIIAPRGLECVTDLQVIMDYESSDLVGFDLGPSFKVRQGEPNLNVLMTCLLLVQEFWDVKLTYKKSWA